MKVILCLLLLLSHFSFASECQGEFKLKGESLEAMNEAVSCFNSLEASSKLEKSFRSNRLSYLYFLKATLFKNDELKNLKKSYDYALGGIKQFSNIFDYSQVSSLNEKELSSLALSYYFYGTSVSKYVEIKGKFEAIKRMGDIKNSMKAILRLKRKSIFYYGAYRTLAIFYYKVPAIAGGSYAKSKKYFDKLMVNSQLSSGLSSYPVNHIFYADFLFRYVGKAESCKELEKVLSINESQLRADYEAIYYETLNDLKIAKENYVRRGC